MKRFVILSSVFWGLILMILFLLKSGKPSKGFYYHGNVNSIYDLVVDFFQQKTSTGLFQWACDSLQYFGSILGYSYKEMNFVVFVVFQPAFILYFFVTTLILLKTKSIIFK